jgi:hypothetical protein
MASEVRTKLLNLPASAITFNNPKSLYNIFSSSPYPFAYEPFFFELIYYRNNVSSF